MDPRRVRILAVTFGLADLVGVGGGEARAETLAEAIALAYETNPTLQAQRANQRALDETWVQARSGYRPQVSASAQARYNETRTPRSAAPGRDVDGDGFPDTFSAGGITENNAGSATLSLSQPLYTGGRVAAQVSAAEAAILAGREQVRGTEAQIVAGVIEAYVDVRRDQDALGIRDENVAVLRRQLEEAKARFGVGEITRTDVAQAESRLALAQALRDQAAAQLASSRADYTAVVGQSPGELVPEPSLAAWLPTAVEQAFEAAEAGNPQLRSAHYAEQASRARVAGARAERLPSLSLQASLGYSGGPIEPFERQDYSRNVTGTAVVSVPLFTGGLINSRVRQSIERNAADRINVEGVRREVLQLATQAWSELIAARANIVSTAEQARAARIAAEGTRQEQQVGLRTTLDVLNAEQELRAAQLAQVQARRDEYVAATAVLAIMGQLDAKRLSPSVEVYDPKDNFRAIRTAWGWVPWEEPIAAVDGALTPKAQELPPAGRGPVASRQ